jgi:hypothetical protein
VTGTERSSVGTPASQGSLLILASSFYTTSLELPFTQALARRGDTRTVACVPYNQLTAFLLNPESIIPKETPATVIVFFRAEDLIRLELVERTNNPTANSELTVRALAERTAQFLEVVKRISLVRLTMLVCPSGHGTHDVAFLGNALRVVEFRSAAALRSQQRHRVILWSDCEREFSDMPMFNIAGDRLGHVPFSPEGLSALAEFFVRQVDDLPTTTLKAQSSVDSGALERFLADLKVELSISLLTPESQEQASNLVRHTTHFINAPADKNAAQDLVAMIATPRSGESWVVRVRDRFGDYGVSGIVTFVCEAETMRIGLWFLTCPVLGKQVESAVVGWMCDMAQRRNMTSIEIPFVQGRDNQVFSGLLSHLGSDVSVKVPDVRSFRPERTFRLSVAGLKDRSMSMSKNPAAATEIYSRIRVTDFPFGVSA